MIFVSHAAPVNVDGQPVLSEHDVWGGLVLKADNALPFVPSMSRCEVVDRITETCFDREIEFRGDRFTERVTLEPEHRVVFTRVAGPVLGTIANEIERDQSDELRLRFSFSLVVAGLHGGSTAEQDYADGMTQDYLRAVTATLDAIRRLVSTSGSVAAPR